MAQFFSTIGRHLECAIQTELDVELRKEAISKGSNIVDLGTILSYARKIRKGLRRLALCQGQRSCRAKNRNIQSKELYLRFPQITPFQPQQFRC